MFFEIRFTLYKPPVNRNNPVYTVYGVGIVGTVYMVYHLLRLHLITAIDGINESIQSHFDN